MPEKEKEKEGGKKGEGGKGWMVTAKEGEGERGGETQHQCKLGLPSTTPTPTPVAAGSSTSCSISRGRGRKREKTHGPQFPLTLLPSGPSSRLLSFSLRRRPPFPPSSYSLLCLRTLPEIHLHCCLTAQGTALGGRDNGGKR